MIDIADIQQRVLVVDDNAYTLRIVRFALEKAHYAVSTATSGQQALELIKRHGVPHLAIVDYHMPNMSGFEFCRAFHEISDSPIIMLTAVTDESTIIECLDKYAEDYISKPFRPMELCARVERVLRRVDNFQYTTQITQLDERLMINFNRREAVVDGEPVSLTRSESLLLRVLVNSAGRIVPTKSIINHLWPLQDAQEDRLHVLVHRLRRKIEADPKKPMYVVARRGTGYEYSGSVAKRPIMQLATS